MPNQRSLRSHFVPLTGISNGIVMPRADLIFKILEKEKTKDIQECRHMKQLFGKESYGWNIKQSMTEIMALIAAAQTPDFKKSYSAFVQLHTPEGKPMQLRTEYICAVYKKLVEGKHDTVVFFGLGDIPSGQIAIRETPEDAAKLIDEAIAPARPALTSPLARRL